ncbi:MAG: hypothetical protein ACK40C_08160 [Novosphingobium meiothermophilum]
MAVLLDALIKVAYPFRIRSPVNANVPAWISAAISPEVAFAEGAANVDTQAA